MATPTPADMPPRRAETGMASDTPTRQSALQAQGVEQATDVRAQEPPHLHAEKIRAFAFFPLVDEEYIADPIARGRQAWASTLRDLAHLAEPEDWEGACPPGRPYPILDSYVRYTYQRLNLENKIAVAFDREVAALNTGLLTKHGEEIFGLFTHNRMAGVQPWRFLKWATESDRILLRNFPQTPEMAQYVRTASDLVFDWNRPLKLAYEHILDDNLGRFPSELAAMPVRARQAVDLAVDWTLKRARRNYKIIVPQWYPPLGSAGAQFLMPLDLTGDQNADLALVVSTVGDTSYRGHTVLTLDMAYTNARLVARPDSEWLTPMAAHLPAADEAFDGAPTGDD